MKKHGISNTSFCSSSSCYDKSKEGNLKVGRERSFFSCMLWLGPTGEYAMMFMRWHLNRFSV